MQFQHSCRLLVLLVVALLAIPAYAIEVEVTVENVSPEGGTLITPMWVGFHMGTFDTYDGGAPAADFPGLEQIAEDGNAQPLSDDFAVTTPLGVQGLLFGPEIPPIRPGESSTGRFELNPDYHRYFSYVSMVIPSNDAFVANGNPVAHRVFDTDGEFTPFSFYILGNETNDAGTEVNDEIPENTAALAQAAPNTGVDENGVVTDHPGFIPGGNVLAAIPNGQFVLPGYVIAKVTVSAAPTTNVYFSGDASQEVPTNNSEATAACHASLNDAQNALTVSCDHNVENVTAAHVHEGVAGVNGDVIFPFDDPTSPFSQTFDVSRDQVETFLAGGYYVNIHSEAFPGGEIRGQVDGCFAGPESLCLYENRFQVTTTFATFNGTEGVGQVKPEGSDSGLVYFFSDDNIEILIKVINGCGAESNSFWVFASGVTNLAVDIEVLDTLTGDIYTINNPLGTDFPPTLDTQAFTESCM